MRIIPTFLIMLLTALVLPAGVGDGTAQAQIFSCQRADGTKVFTDDPGLFPPDCRTDSASDNSRGTLSVVHFPPGMVIETNRFLRQLEENKEKQELNLEELEQEVTDLVAEYNEMRIRILRSTDNSDRRKYRSQLVEIKNRRDILQQKIQSANLSSNDRNKVLSQLEAIPR